MPKSIGLVLLDRGSNLLCPKVLVKLLRADGIIFYSFKLIVTSSHSCSSSKPKGSGSKARLTSIDEIAEPTSKNQISKPSRDSEDNTKCENSPQNLVESCNNSAKPSDRTDDVNNSKISSHLKQHRQSTAKSKVKAHMIKTPGSVGIGYLKCH